MKKSTKGAVAAAGAAVVLLGGAGTLAYWSDSETVTGATVSTGDLQLNNVQCGAGWEYADGEGTGAFDPAADKLVPGDTIAKTCTVTVVAKGKHLRGTIGASTPTWSATDTDLTVSAVSTLGGAPLTTFTSANDGQTVQVAIQVSLAGSDTNAQNLSAALGDITLTATQAHS